jgi:hypothetical protein
MVVEDAQHDLQKLFALRGIERRLFRDHQTTPALRLKGHTMASILDQESALGNAQNWSQGGTMGRLGRGRGKFGAR